MPQAYRLPRGFHTVIPSMNDVARATAFFDLVELSEWGVSDFEQSANEVADGWNALDLEKSVVLVENEREELVASMTLVANNGVSWEAYGCVHPDYRQRGLGAWIIRWSETRATERENEMRDGIRIELLNLTAAVNEPAHRLLHDLGYECSRLFRRMRIDLQERPDPVVWPSGLELRPFVEGRDERAFFQALATTFVDHWSAAPRTFEQWELSMKNGAYDTGLWLQLFDGDKIVGIASGKISETGGWISHVGVLPSYRRRGLARRLLVELFGRYWDRNIERIDLGVDAANRYSAIDLYLGAGMRLTHSYEAHRKVLREGHDWRDEE